LDYAFDFFFAAHRAFIIADNFFRTAALIGLRAVAFLETVVCFFGLLFCFAHQALLPQKFWLVQTHPSGDALGRLQA